jgi:hypothetical protein
MKTGRKEPRRVSLALLALGVAAACRSEPPPPDLVPRDACALVTEAELEAIAGQDVRSEAVEIGARRSECLYWDSTGTRPVIQLTVLWAGGREELEVHKRSMDLASQPPNRVGPDSGPPLQPGPVLGLGDEAYFSDILPSFVLSGDRLIQVFVTFLPEARTNFVPLARLMLGRL